MRYKVIIAFLLSFNCLFSQSPNFTTDLLNNENCGPATVTFTIDVLTDVNTYAWDFGNGEPIVTGTIDGSDNGTSSTTYTSPGIYTATLTINGDQSSSQTINIFALPTPSFTATNTEACLHGEHTVNFTYTGTVPAFGANVVEWTWNFGDESPVETNSLTGDATHTYSKYGNFTVILDVIDANGCTNNYFEPEVVKIYSTPEANFDIYYDESCSFPLDIELVNRSTNEQNDIGTHEWTITEQTGGSIIASSTDEDAMLTLPAGGDYYITLKVTSSVGDCIDEITKPLSFPENTVDFLPNTSFEICQGQEVEFTDLSTDSNGETPTAWSWKFGDNGTSDKQNPKHTFNDFTESPYSVTLEATFKNGCKASKTRNNLVIVNEGGIPEINVDKDESCGIYTANFSAKGGASLYEWDFDYNGITPNYTVSSIDSSATHIYVAEGAYQVLLQVTTAQGCVLKATYDSIRIKYPEPYFYITGGQTGCIDEEAIFNADSSTNIYPTDANAIVEYRWDFENDGIDDYISTEPTASKMYNREGEFDVKLTILTETGCEKSIIKKKIVERGYPANSSFIITQPNACRNTAVQFQSTSTPHILSSFLIDSLEWYFGDGASLVGNPNYMPGINAPAHVYTDDTEDSGTPFTAYLFAYSNGCTAGPDSSIIEIGYPVARVERINNDQCAPKNVIRFQAYDPASPARLSEGVDQYRWDFGDGNLYPGPTENDYATGFDPSIFYTYTKAGFYTYTLYVKNNTSGCEDTFSDLVSVHLANVNFEADNTIICYSGNQQHVNFTNLSVSTAPNITYTWDFGEGADPRTYEGDIPPTIRYTTSGLKTVSLIMDQEFGCISSKIKENYIDVRGPLPEFTWTSENDNNAIACKSPEQVVTYQSTTDPNQNTNINILYNWDFGEGAQPRTLEVVNHNPIDVIYTTPGEKTVSLTILDSRGCQDTTIKENIIHVPEPYADFTVQAGNNYCINENIIFRDRSIDNEDFSIVNWEWHFGEGANPEVFFGKNPPVVTYSSIGTKQVELKVTNNTGCTNNFYSRIDIYEANAFFTAPSAVGCAPAQVDFTDHSTDIAEWHWDFGDGGTSTSQHPNHIYTYPGIYPVTLTTVSKGGCEAVYQKVNDIHVAGSFYNDMSYTIDHHCLNNPEDPLVTFTINGLVDVKKITLDFGDGSPAFEHEFDRLQDSVESFEISHNYFRTGTFEPKLTLEDDASKPGACGAFVYIPDLEPIIISEKPNAYFTENTAEGEGCVNNAVIFTDESTINDSRYPIISWYWEFGDGATSTDQHPEYTYPASGTYTVSLTINTDMACDTTYSEVIVINEPINDLTTGGELNTCDLTPPLLDAATPTGGNGEFVFLWEESYNNYNWEPAEGTNTEEDYQVLEQNSTEVEVHYYRRLVYSSTCLFTSPTYVVTIDPETQAGYIKNGGIVCYGENEGILELIEYTGSVNYWEKGKNPAFGNSDIIDNTDDTLHYSNLYKHTYYRVNVQSGVCPDKLTEEVQVEVLPEITGNIIDPDMEICSDENPGSITATPPDGGEGNFTYQWQNSADSISWSNIQGANTESYSPGFLIQTTYYRRLVTSNGLCTVASDAMEIFVTTAPKTDREVIANDVCDDDDAVITIKKSENSFSYRVLDRDKSNIEVANGIGNGGDLDLVVLETDLPDNGAIFRFVIQVDNGGLCVRNFPNDSLYVDSIPDLTLDVSDIGAVCYGDDGIITIHDSQEDLLYEIWDNTSSAVLASGYGTGSDVDIIVPSENMLTSGLFSYKVTVLNGACDKQLEHTGEFIIIGVPDTAIEVTDPFICEESFTLDTVITIKNSETGVEYQVRRDSDNLEVSTPALGNGSDLDITIQTPLTTTIYNVLAYPILPTGTGQHCDSVELVDKSTVTIVPTPSNTLEVTDPVACPGSQTTITVKNTETDVKYSLKDAGSVIVTKVGTGSDIEFTISTPPSDITYEVWAITTLNNGNCDEIKLVDEADVTVIDVPLNTATVSDPFVCEGSGTIDIVVDPTEASVKYALVEQGGSPVDTLDGSGSYLTFTISEPTASTVYEIYAFSEVQNSNGEYCEGVKLIDEAVVTFAPTPDVSLNVLSDSVCYGTKGVISIENSETGVSYTLREKISDEIVAPLIDGNGNTISFEPVDVIETTTFEIIATSNTVNCAKYMLTEEPIIKVIQTPDPNLNVAPTDTTICFSDQVEIRVNGSETDVLYKLRIGTVEVAGQEKEGTGGTLTFKATLGSNTELNILAIPISQNSSGETCSSTQLTQTVNVTVEGPLTVAQAPSDAHICAGSDASFEIIIDNGNEGIVQYQWKKSGIDISAGDTDFSGYETAKLTVTNAATYAGTPFTVEVWTAECTAFESDPVTVESSSAPDVSNLNITIDDICLNSDGTVNFTSNLIQNESYRFTYNLTGENIANGLTATTIIANADGSGSFAIPATELTNTGTTTVTVTQVDFGEGSSCISDGLAVSDPFVVDPVPVTESLAIHGNDICLDYDEHVIITSTLIDGTYDLTYNLTGANTLTDQTERVIITNGTGGFDIAAENLPNEGSNTITLINIAFSTGIQCAEGSLGLTTDFLITPRPATDLTVNGDIICLGNSGIISIDNSVVGVEYQLRTDIGDLNIGSPVDGTGGYLEFVPVNPTETTVYEIVASSTIQDCHISILDNKPEVVVLAVPDANLNIDPGQAVICAGTSQDITISGTEPDVHYTLRIGTDNVVGQEFIGDGTDQSFSVAPTVNTVYNVIAQNTLSDGYGNLCAPEQMVQFVSIEVEGAISIAEQPIDAHVCSDSIAHFIVLANNGNGGTLEYQWNMDGTPLTDGGDFAGTNSPILYVNNVLDYTGNAFTVDVSTAECNTVTSNTVTIVSSVPPNISYLSITTNDICLNSDGLVNFTSQLDEGVVYQFTYSLSGANTSDTLQANSVSVSADGSGSFNIPASELDTAGVTSITIYAVDYPLTNTCVSSGLAISSPFTVFDLPNINTLELSTTNICLGEPQLVSLTSSLADESYQITYDLSGSNVSAGNTALVTVVSGAASFIIPAASLATDGNTTISITDVSFYQGLNCNSTINSTGSNFNIIPPPDTELSVNSDVICIGDNGIISVENSELNVIYELRTTILNNRVGNLIAGTGGTIEFDPVSPVVHTLYEVRAWSSLLECDTVTLTQKAGIQVIPEPDANINVSPTTAAICSGNSEFISVDGTENAVLYELRIGNEPVAGQFFIGNGTTQTFEVSPIVDTTYNILATPTIVNGNNESCNSVELTQTVRVQVEGPITIEQHPFNANICGTGTQVQFTVEAMHGNGGLLGYHWYNENGPLNESDADFSGVNTATLTVDNAGTYENINFYVKIGTNECDTVISNTADIFDLAAPDITGFTITGIDNICAGNDAVVNFNAGNLIDNRYYKFVFNLSGANSELALKAYGYVESGAGYFKIPASEIQNTGTTAVTIHQIEFAAGSPCATSGLNETGLFEIEPLPYTEDLTISTHNICIGNYQIVYVSGNLSSDIYDITYELSGANEFIAQKTKLVVVNGEGIFEIPKTSLANAGITTVTIHEIAFASGEQCAMSIENLSSEFNIENRPNVAILELTVQNICENNDAIAKVTSTLSDGEYLLNYSLFGVNHEENVDVIVNFYKGDGTGEFIIPSNYLKNKGLNYLVLNDVVYNSGEHCEKENISEATWFLIENTPDAEDLSLYTENICISNNVTVLITSNLDDGFYTLNYQINGANNIFNVNEDINLNTGDGIIVFSIPADTVPNSGLNTITLNNLQNSISTQKCSFDLEEQDNFYIQAKPDTSNLQLAVNNTCPNVPVAVNISGSLTAQDYVVYYHLEGANTADSILTTVSIDAMGKGSFLIPALDLGNPGETTIIICSISSLVAKQCTIDSVKKSTSFIVEERPLLETSTVSVANVCPNTFAEVIFEADVLDGYYDISYELKGVNILDSTAYSVSISGGQGIFYINPQNITVSGENLLTITSVEALWGESCAALQGEYASTSFTTEPSPNTSGIKPIALNACLGSSALVYCTSNLENDSYVITYNISGYNEATMISDTVYLTKGNGNFAFYVPDSLLTNTGSNTIEITNIQILSGQSCAIGLSASSNFTIYDLPNVDSIGIDVNPICQESDAVVFMNSKLYNGKFDIIYSISGANNHKEISTEVICENGDGSTSFIVSADLLPNYGTNFIEIHEVIDTKGAHCGLPVEDASTEFVIEPAPIVNDFKIDVSEICQHSDAVVSVISWLTEGTYRINYTISGTNSINFDTALVIAADGSGNFIVPSEQIPNSGESFLTINSVAHTTGLNCEVPVDETDDFFIVALDLTFDAQIKVDDICLGAEAAAVVSTNLPNKDYLIHYNLSGANTAYAIETMITLTSGDGQFIIPDSLLSLAGIQNISISDLTVLDIDQCMISNLTINTSFNIEQTVAIINQPVSQNLCEGNTVTIELEAEPPITGSIYYKWQESTDSGMEFIDLADLGVYSGSDTETLSIIDNTGLHGNIYRALLSTDQCSGIYSDTLLLEVYEGSHCGFGIDNLPNAFSPNGDGVNDYWHIEGMQFYENNKVQVFTSSGRMVFESSGYNNSDIYFDGIANTGRSKGDELPDGTYFYVIDLGDGSEIYKGYLVINR